MTQPSTNDSPSPAEATAVDSEAAAEVEPTPGDAATSADDTAQSSTSDKASTKAGTKEPEKPQSKGSNLWMWLVGIACILSIELYIYGHNGWVRVCVGIEGATKFELLDQPKGHGGRGYPVCAEQMNLGMYSRSEDAAQESLDVACTRGATLIHGNKQDCLRKEHGWIRRVDKAQVAPWDPRLFRRMLFLD